MPEGRTPLAIADLIGEPRHIVLLAVPHSSLLEVAGPLEVFALAALKLSEAGRTRARPYQVHLVSATAGPLAPGLTGVPLQAECSYADFDQPIDTLLVVGGLNVWEGPHDPALMAWLSGQARRSRRFGSICTGAFVLAAAGLLDHHRVTTHWYFCERLAREYPLLTVDPEPIFIREGPLFTAAGVTAGIDLALAMVEEDVGVDIAVRIARGLVLYVRRPGWLSQFSSSLSLQASSRMSFRDLPFWIVENLGSNLTVTELARRSGMSPRNFARLFVGELGVTPARFIAELRAETALRMLADTPLSREAVAEECGLGSVDSMERAIAAYARRPGAAFIPSNDGAVSQSAKWRPEATARRR